MTLNRIRIVLVEPSHGGNVGGCARAMKNMGLSQLVVVGSQDLLNDEAAARAAGAEDVLASARVCRGLDEAVGDCQLVVGTSARRRRIPWPVVYPREAAARIVGEPASHQVAVLFGRERTGLTNDELDRCQLHVNIPTVADFSSLNLACAVQVIAYEIWCAANPAPSLGTETEAMLGEPLATRDEVQRYYEHLEQVLVETGFLDPKNPRLLMRRLMRLYNRVALTANEVNILRGILAAVTQHYKQTRN